MQGDNMNINFSSIGIGSRTFGIGDQTKVDGQKMEGQNIEGQKTGEREFRLSNANAVDILVGSEPVADVPDSELARDDGLGHLVSSAFNLPPPPMPEFTD